MDGIQATSPAPLITDAADQAGSEIDTSLQRVRAGHPDFLPLEGMSFISEDVKDVSQLKNRVLNLASVLDTLRTDFIEKAEEIKNTDKTIQSLTTKIYEKQTVELVNEITKAKSAAAVKSYELERIQSEQERSRVQAALNESTLREQLAQLRSRAQDLENEIKMIEAEKSAVVRENDKYKAHLVRLQDETWEKDLEAGQTDEREAAHQALIASLNGEVASRENMIAKLNDRLEMTETALADQRLANEKAATQFEKERAQLVQALARAQDAVFERQAESLRMQTTIVSLRKTIDEYKTQSANRQQHELIDSLKDANTKLAAHLKEKEAAYLKAATSASERTGELARARDNERELRAQNAKIAADAAQIRFESQESSAQAKAAQSTLEAQRTEWTSMERSLRLEIETLKFETADQTQELSALKDATRDLERAVSEERTSFRLREQDLERANAGLKAELERSQASGAQANDRLNAMQSQLAHLQGQLEDMRTEREEASLRATVSEARAADLAKRFEEERADVLRLSELVSQKETEIQVARRERFARVEGEFEKQEQARKALETERDELKDGVHNLRTLVARRENELKMTALESQRRVEALEAEVQREIENARAETARETATVRTESAREIALARAEADTLRETSQRELLAARSEAVREIAAVKANVKREVETVRTETSRDVLTARTEAERSIEAMRIESQREIVSARTEAERTVETARTEAERAVETARAEAQREVAAAQAHGQRQLEIASLSAEKEVEIAKASAFKLVEAARAGAERQIEQIRSTAARQLDEAKKKATSELAQALLDKSTFAENSAKEIAALKKALDAKLTAEGQAEEASRADILKDRTDLSKQASRQEMREQQLRNYAQAIQDEGAEVVRCTQQLANEIQAARNMNPLEDYLKLTEFELSKIELQLKRTPTLSSERPKLEKFLTQMTEQRDFLQGVIEQSKKNLDQQAKKLARIVEAARLSPLPPLPPKQK